MYESLEHLARLQLRFDWRSLIYTDGSCQKDAWGEQHIGAGVVIPGKKGHDQHRSYLVDPGGEGVSNTVNRAELSAILAALRLMEELGPASSTPRTILTDSACSLSLIRQALRDPNSLWLHKHKPLLTAIASIIKCVASTHGPVQLVKCKAHSGVVGNEMADEASKQAAKPRTPHDTSCADVAPHPYSEGMYWLAEAVSTAEEGPSTAVGGDTPATDTTGDETGEPPHYLSDLHKDLSKHVKTNCCTGAAKTSPGFYATAWEAVRKSALGDISNAFATTAPLAQRRTVWNTRAGVLMNKKLEQRWFKRGDGNCPLCGQPDSCTHIASGCPKLSGLYTERHNRAARILLKAILKGSLGACIHQADIGCADKLAAAGLTLDDAHRRVGKDLLPRDVASNQTLYDSLSRPDATLICNSPPRVEVLEVKICRDTDRSVQLERADKQHAALLSHMERKLASSVKLTTFAFGATGTVYTDNLDQLVRLGVDAPTARRTLRKIHDSVVQDLHTIVCTRRHQERLQPQAPPIPSNKQPTSRRRQGNG
jgi:ribonuclease HI